MKQDESARESRPSRRKLLAWAGAAAIGAGAAAAGWKHFSGTVQVKVESFFAAGDGRKKNVLVLSGSGRKGGNTELLASAFAKGAREAGHDVHAFNAALDPMRGCMHCGGCWSRNAPCVMDDGFSRLYPLIEQAELLVLCSPLYWYSLSGHLKCAMDRLYPYFQKDRPRSLKVRETMLLMCGQTRLLRSFAGAAETYRQGIGFAGWRDRGRLFATGVDGLGAIAGSSALAEAETMGRGA